MVADELVANPRVAFMKTGPEILSRYEQHPVTGQQYAVFKQTIMSEPLYLRNGEVTFTQFHDTVIPMPNGDYAILSLRGEVVDCNNISVPLTTGVSRRRVGQPHRVAHFVPVLQCTTTIGSSSP